MPETHPFQLATVVSAPFDQVAYVAWVPGNSHALVVDPGFDTRSLFSILEQIHLKPAALLNTHGHADHIAGNAAMKRAYPEVPLIIGKNEAHLLTDPDANLSRPLGVPISSPPADQLVADGERLELAGFRLLVREIPGHSPGSVVYICEGLDPLHVFGGDVLFAGSVGRVDFPGGSGATLAAGIRAKLFSLADNTVILPGHGPPTTVGVEKRSNPFVGENPGTYRLD